MTERQPFQIPSADLVEGQLLRANRDQAPQVVTRIIDADQGRRIVDLSSDLGDGLDVTGIVTFPPGGGVLTTFLTQAQASQPGMDYTSARCATCDSRRCAHLCANPWVADRELVAR